jgi:uncharacterized FlaG/YvyC family protein
MRRHAVNFDTLAYANKLKEAGVPEKQAEAQSAALIELFDYQAATKKDLQEAESRLKQDLKEIESQLNAKFDNKIAEVEIKIAEIKVEIIKWIVGLFFAQSALLISFLKIFH